MHCNFGPLSRKLVADAAAGKGPAGGKAGGGLSASGTIMKDFRVEVAKAGGAGCRVCEEKIKKVQTETEGKGKEKKGPGEKKVLRSAKQRGRKTTDFPSISFIGSFSSFRGTSSFPFFRLSSPLSFPSFLRVSSFWPQGNTGKREREREKFPFKEVENIGKLNLLKTVIFLSK